MIIFLNGSLNSGKSTIAKLLAEKLPQTAIVEIDTLRSFIDWMPIQEAVPINLENAIGIIKNFAKRDFHVIVPYPLSQKNYRYLLDNLQEYKDKVYTFTLNPRLEVILSKRGERDIDEWEKERMIYHYENGLNKPQFGIIIDNSEQNPNETAKEILMHLHIL